jgi:hypothetical protein
MKKSIIILVVLVIIGAVAWSLNKGGSSNVPAATESEAVTNPAPNPSSIEKVSDKVSSYKNEELGFAVKYPTTWTSEAAPSGVLFSAPIKPADVGENTLGKLQVNIDVFPGSCSFPQVTTIKERDSIKVKDATFSMIAMSNAVQGREYFNRMYSTAKGSVCYMFNFSSVTSNPSSKGYSAADLTKVTANNKALIASADVAFKELVKSFEFVVTPDGDNEALHSPSAK